MTFESASIRAGGTGLTVEGTLTVVPAAPEPLAAVVDLDRTRGDVHARCSVVVVQSEFGVTPYSAMLGQLQVADEVRVDPGPDRRGALSRTRRWGDLRRSPGGRKMILRAPLLAPPSATGLSRARRAPGPP